MPASSANRAPRLDRDQVIRTSIRLLDDVGLDGLTLRRLAAELGVQAPALYWHFANKQDLLDHVAHAMTEPWLQAVPATGVGRRWDEWLTEVGRSYRTLLLSHRDGARLVASTRPLPDSLPLLDGCIAVFQVSTNCSAGQALQCLTTITTYVRGFVLDEYAELLRSQAQPDRADAECTTIPNPALQGAPRMDAAIEEIGSPNGEGAFEYGLHIIVGGIRSAVVTHRT
ncbi:MAG TPA: TetR/AcrR family transcriptional regulator C-terminal domain-containing protein [Candidatus Limnocylindrales bacterium]